MPQPALVQPLRRWDPEQVGGFVLVGRLGAGAMGRVYLGRSAAGRLVAVKTIKVELAEEPDFRTRFAQEVAAARRVSGAFTAAVVAADPEADLPWLATAYVPAPSLSQLVRTCGPLPVPAVRWLAAGCAEALESIHGAGLVHRDLKPSNVLVSLDGPRVIDFGVARAAERIQLTVTRGAVGTPAYMAPEQARDTRHATVASDVFALGGTMLFAATGHAPYQGETVMDVLVRLATEEPDMSGLPGSLAEIVLACLQRDPRRRPTSAAVVAGLAPFISAEAGGSDAGAAFLPGAARALIAEYRRDPRPSAEATAQAGPEAGEDATVGSQPGLRGAPAGGGPARPKTPGWQRPLVVIVAAVAAAAAAMALGAVIGAAITGTNGSNGSNAGKPQPVRTVTLPPPPPQSGSSALPAPRPGKPVAGMIQNFGDSHTVFVVIGRGWPPGQPVTVTLVGVGPSPVHPVADSAGNFNYAINQDHEFFRGGLPLRTYRVAVTGPGGGRAKTSFLVDHS